MTAARGIACADRASGRPPAGATLPQLSRDLALAGNRLFATLDGVALPAGAGWLKVRRDGEPRSGPWLRFRAGAGEMALQPRRIGGRPAVWPGELDSPVLAEALAACAQLEPMLLALEQALGCALEPLGMGAAPALRLRVDLVGPQGGLRQQVALAFDPAATLACAPQPRWARLADRLPLDLRLELPGPTVPREELAQLATGDILLTPLTSDAAWPARLSLEQGRGRFAGRYDPRRRRLVVEAVLSSPSIPHEVSMSLELSSPAADGLARPTAHLDADQGAAIPQPSGPPAAFAAALGETGVALTVVLPGFTASLRQLAELGPGCVLDLAVADELKVSVMAGDRQIAGGQLVALGPGYGVLIEETSGS